MMLMLVHKGFALTKKKVVMTTDNQNLTFNFYPCFKIVEDSV